MIYINVVCIIRSACTWIHCYIGHNSYFRVQTPEPQFSPQRHFRFSLYPVNAAFGRPINNHGPWVRPAPRATCRGQGMPVGRTMGHGLREGEVQISERSSGRHKRCGGKVPWCAKANGPMDESWEGVGRPLNSVGRWGALLVYLYLYILYKCKLTVYN